MFLMFLASWWFWLVLAEIIVLCVLVEYEEGFWGLASIGVFLVLMWWLAGVDFAGFLRDNWGALLTWALVYIPIGSAWGFFKWWFYVHGIKDKARDYLRRNEESLTQNFKQRNKKFLDSRSFEKANETIIF